MRATTLVADDEGTWLDCLFPRRRARSGVDRRDSAGSLADAEIGPRRQHELGIDEQIALVHVAVRVGQELDLPVGRGVANLRLRVADEPVHPSAKRRAAVQPVELFGERPDRLLLEDRNDAFEPRVLARVEVDGVAAGRERRVLKRLEVLRMFSTTASMMSRAWRRGGDAAGSVVCETMAPGKIYAANAAKS